MNKKMPGISFHVSHSISSPEKAREIHEALDNIHGLPFFTHKIHGKVRKLTHNIPTAIIIGYTLNGRKGVIDALNHLKDDMIYNKLFYNQKIQREREAKRKQTEELRTLEEATETR